MTDWKSKLMALLHDPPCKVLNIAEHESIAEKFRIGAGIDPEEYKNFAPICDHTASAADRFPFPGSRASGCSARFKGDEETPFRHPLGGGDLKLGVAETAEQAIGQFQDTSGSTDFSVADLEPEEEWKIRHFLYWRRWPVESAQHDPRLAYLPADTRMPDHTIWNHMSLTSAFQGCVNGKGELEPAFLLFQLGPVQEFIAAARSTRDLWSGSYLLSWLAAHAVKAVTDHCGPDSIIFPSLRGLGIYDAVCREDIYRHVHYKEDPLWSRMYQGNEHHLLSPSLPNRFLAVVPASNAEEIAKLAQEAVHMELSKIFKSCRSQVEELIREYRETEQGKQDNSNTDDWFDRWEKQLAIFPQISWQVSPWDLSNESLLEQYGKLPLNKTADNSSEYSPHEALETLRDLACDKIPVGHRDDRFYEKDSGRTKLNNPGMLWSAYYGLTDYALAARRNTRDFQQWNTDANQHGAVKDSLTGVEECIGSEPFWEFLTGHSEWSEIFKPESHRLGGINLLKRLWCRAETGYLPEKLGIYDKKVFKKKLGFDSVAEVADAQDERRMKKDSEGKPRPSYSYFAVIAMDGDEMGKWVCGKKTPEFGSLLASSVKQYFESQVADSSKALKAPRPLSPSFHLQFSEALTNFANVLVPKVLDAYDAQLVYSGGDDVLLMVRGDRAIECAYTLRSIFKGDDKLNLSNNSRVADEYFKRYWPANIDLNEHPAGWVTTLEDNAEKNKKKRQVHMVPGPEADLSCGIAIAHYQHPLQHVVTQAKAAESRAKKPFENGGYNRGAFAVNLLKRGGETIQWGGKWSGQSLPLYFQYRSYRLDRSDRQMAVSARFPYALSELLRPYDFSGKFANIEDVPAFNPAEIIEKDLLQVIERQNQCRSQEARERLTEDLKETAMNYVNELTKYKNKGRKAALDDFEKLFLVAAFIDRNDKEE